MDDFSNAFDTVLTGLTATGIVGTPQAQAAAQSNLFGVSQAGLSLGGIQIPVETLVLIGIVVLAGLYLANHHSN